MATWSGFGFSGWAPFESYGEGQMQMHFDKKMSKWLSQRQLEQNKAWHTWASTETPSLNRAGLIKAGLNPILAANGGASASSMSMPSASVDMGNSVSGADPSSFNEALFGARTRKQELANMKSIENLNNANAKAVDLNSETNQWQIVDVRSQLEGALGGGLGKAFPIATINVNGRYMSVSTMRVNRRTGVAYDVLTGRKIEFKRADDPAVKDIVDDLRRKNSNTARDQKPDIVIEKPAGRLGVSHPTLPTAGMY